MDYRTRRLANGVIVVCVLAIVASIAIGVLTSKAQGVQFTVVFEDAQGLPVGAPVTLRGLRVGEVTRVELAKDHEHVEIDLAIRPEYTPEIPEEGITARIKKSLVLPGNYAVALVILKDAKGQMPNGARIEGVDNWAEEKKFVARGALSRAYDAAVDKTHEKMEAFKAWWAERGQKKEREEVQQQLLEWLDEWENLDADTPPTRLAALRVKAERLAEEWREKGFEEEAMQLEEIADSIRELEAQEAQGP